MLFNIHMYDVDNIMSKSRSEMIKFVLVFIAVILMGLGIYNYSNQSTEIHTPTPTISEKKKEVKEIEKVSVVTQEVKEKESSVERITVQSSAVISKEPIPKIENEEMEMGEDEEIGKGLTVESIDNASVSNERKEIMRSDMAYFKSLNTEPSVPLSHEEIVKMVEDDVKNGLIP